MEDITKLEDGTRLTIYFYDCDIKVEGTKSIIDIEIFPQEAVKQGSYLEVDTNILNTRFWVEISEENKFQSQGWTMWSRDNNRKAEFVQSCKEVLTHRLDVAKEETKYYEDLLSTLER